MSESSKTALLTVGSTEFTALVLAGLSSAVLSALHALHFTRLIVQAGNSDLSSLPGHGQGVVKEWEGRVEVEILRFANDLEDKMREAELVLSHAGAGSILAALRGPALRPFTEAERDSSGARRKQLIVVPNDTLMDAHQSELANELAAQGWARVAMADAG